jgi:xanthine dehydrogenase accessory factor
MDTAALIDQGIRLLENGEALELVKIVSSAGSTPRGSDAFMIVGKSGPVGGTVGGGAVERRSAEDAASFLLRKEDGKKSYSLTRSAKKNIGMICGGDVEITFRCLSGKEGTETLRELERKLRKQRPAVWIFGGGHVSYCTASELARIGFDVRVYDDRKELASRERFPEASEVIAAPYDEIAKRLKIGAGDYILIMTESHEHDYEVQKFALGTEAVYIGVIGSHAKAAELSNRLSADGFSAEKIASCHAPVGIQIGAETPEEIAVSIAAEMILVRARQEKRRKVLEHKVIDYR